jgi:Uncharacterised protein family (UPF0236)
MRRLRLLTSAGKVETEIPYCQSMEDGTWCSPLHEAFAIAPGEVLSPELLSRLALTAAHTFSYASAAKVCAVWGSPVADDSTIHRHVQRAGGRAEQHANERARQAPLPAVRDALTRDARTAAPQRGFSLFIMMDGFMTRNRAPDWGKKPAEETALRVEWREMKTAIVVRCHDRAETAGGRRVLVEKRIVALEDTYEKLWPQLYAEAAAMGLHAAREVFVVADGGLWIWTLAGERLPAATGVLDFYHASQHLWAVAQALHGEGTEEAKNFAIPLLHQLRHGGEAGVLRSLEDLAALAKETMQDGTARETILREQRYFETHKQHIHYKAISDRGCPVGSGAMESTCAQLQGRLKRTGQFWTKPGKSKLLALILADHNGHWGEITECLPIQT